jgi:hypothetical protein
MMFMNDIGFEAWALVDAEQAGYAAGDRANGAADDFANRPRGAIAFAGAFFGAAHDALGAGGDRQGEKDGGRGDNDPELHFVLQMADGDCARRSRIGWLTP